MDKYEKKIRAIRLEQDKEREAITKKLLPEYKKKWVGRCFTFRDSYGTDCKGWWIYAKIKDVCGVNFIRDGTPEPNFTVFKFQKCVNNKITIDLDHFEYRLNDWTEIKPKKFEQEFKKLKAYVDDKV